MPTDVIVGRIDCLVLLVRQHFRLSAKVLRQLRGWQGRCDPLHELAAKAADLDAAGAKGVYFTPNQLRPDLVGDRFSARDGDVVRWRRTSIRRTCPGRGRAIPANLTTSSMPITCGRQVCSRVSAGPASW